MNAIVMLEALLASSAPAATPVAEDTARDTIRPFRVNIPEAALVDLRNRLTATRLPEQETVSDNSQGVPLATVRKLVRYWANEYDWRKVEAKLNSYPNFITEIDGLDIHFIHVRSKHENALPVIVTHGWPGSIIEQLKIIDPLVNPTAHGGSASDAFHVVIPSIPGYGFSGKPTSTGWNPVSHRAGLDGLDEAPWLHAVRRAGRRLGCDYHGRSGHTGTSGTAGHSLEHARRDSIRH